jgi:multidrug efflux pump subunit AcrB
VNGVLEWCARNRVAANLMMLMIVLGGLLALEFGVRREVFPLFSLDMISVVVPYPGATPQEVEEGILQPIEEAVASLDGVDELNATAAENAGTVIVKVRTDANARELMNDIKTKVDAITTFPVNAEEPVIEELSLRLLVITVALSSETADERTMRLLAEDVRDDLLTIPGITQVKFGGARPYEIGIHVSETDLRRYGLTFDDVAQAVRASSLNLPAGSIRSNSGDIRIRTQSQAYRQREFENLVLLTGADGTRVQLKDVAEIVDGFEENERWARFDNRSAVMLSVQATSQENAPDVARAVYDFIEGRRGSLPAGVHLDTWMDASEIYSDREDLMIRNGLTGLLLVFISLGLFLHLRLAFWVAVGLALSFIGTFAVLWYAGVSINMISMAAFILVLGIVVDDAIVVAESVHRKHAEGLHGEDGSVAGVQEVATPVIFAVLTSVIAFTPMLAISGVDGKFWAVIPIVIISCLLLSLLESLFILPAHLAHEKTPWYLLPFWPVFWVFEHIQRVMDRLLKAFVGRIYQPVLGTALSWRYMTFACFVAAMIVVVGLIAGGRVKAAFFPRMPGDIAVATLEMPNGTPAASTREILERIEAAALQLRAEIDGEGKEPKAIKHVLVAMGSHPVAKARDPSGIAISAGGTHLAEAAMEFQNLDARGLSSEALTDRWRELVGLVPGVRRLTFDANDGEHEKDIHLRLTSDSLEDLEAAAAELKDELRGYAGVYEISDTLGTRQSEITLNMLPAGEVLGLREADLGRQVRQAFYGAEAQRIQRGRDDIRVMVRYPQDQRRSIADLENLRIRTVSGEEIPLAEAARVKIGEGLATIRRAERRRMADVTALLQRDITANADGIMRELEAEGDDENEPGFLASLSQRYPGMTWYREGGMKGQQRVMTELGVGFLIALFAMYGLMAVAFKSYVQPLLVAIAIPFGFVGAVIGHILLGETISIISFLGLVALAGVVVNDSLVLIDAINRHVRNGMEMAQAVVAACRRRFRAILLTSLTTFLGLTPLMSETSFQAKFMIPMAVALAFGVAFATFLTLLLVPCLYLIIEDLKRIARFVVPAEEQIEPPTDESETDDDASAEGEEQIEPPTDEPETDDDASVDFAA